MNGEKSISFSEAEESVVGACRENAYSVSWTIHFEWFPKDLGMRVCMYLTIYIYMGYIKVLSPYITLKNSLFSLNQGLGTLD